MTSLANMILSNPEAFSGEFQFSSVTFKDDRFGFTVTKYYTENGDVKYGIRYKDLEYLVTLEDIEQAKKPFEFEGKTFTPAESFYRHLDSLICSFSALHDENNTDVAEIKDYDIAMTTVYMLQDDMMLLFVGALGIDDPTDEQVELLELAHFYYTKRNELTDSDLTIINEKFQCKA